MLDHQRILQILPHRYPFLLVDRILEVEPGKRVVGVKNVTFNEPFFQGHFPGNPVMPGVLILEALAQAGGVLVLSELPEEELRRKLIYFMAIDNARFRRPVVPGDQLRLELSVMSMRSRSCKMRGEAFVGEELAAEAEMMSMLVDRDANPGSKKKS